MATLLLDPEQVIGTIKPMHCVNNGPVPVRDDQSRGNFPAYAAAKIPFARNHDASYCAAYGGEHCVDIPMIFPDFARDPEDPEAYDFALTDEYIRTTFEAGTETFYRLGSKIEHWIRKYNTLPPTDFKKWAEICEHVIAHYTEGWANGFFWHITYWEIWNEPDLDDDDSSNKRCWGGTAAEFYELYAVAATHLKQRFPHLKIGGPALAYRQGEWLDGFLARLTAGGNRVPLDFFSWHGYMTTPQPLVDSAALIRGKLDRAGYTQTESILNEYNYVRGWSKEFIYSIKTIIGMKGAAFTAACMCAGQNCGLDMLMYYDARPSAFNGMFDFYTFEPLKGYYPFLAYSELYQRNRQVACSSDDPEVFTVAARGGDGSLAVLICYYTDDDSAAAKEVVLRRNSGGFTGARCRILDREHNLTESDLPMISGSDLTLTMVPNSVLLVIQ